MASVVRRRATVALALVVVLGCRKRSAYEPRPADNRTSPVLFRGLDRKLVACDEDEFNDFHQPARMTCVGQGRVYVCVCDRSRRDDIYECAEISGKPLAGAPAELPDAR